MRGPSATPVPAGGLVGWWGCWRQCVSHNLPAVSVKSRSVLPPGAAACSARFPVSCGVSSTHAAAAYAYTLPVVPALPLRVPDGDAAAAADGSGAVDLSGGTALAQKIWEEFDADTLAERGVIVAGDPDSCIKAAKLHEATGVDQLQFLMATETVAHDQVMESIELFGKQVIPAFR